MNTSSSVVEDGENGKVVDDIDNEKVKAPYLGLFFHSIDEAKSYYEEYGRQNGFCVRRRSSNKTKIGVDEVTSVKFVCSREGKHTKRDRKNGNDVPVRSCSTVKWECQACMRILYNEKILKWSVSVFSDDHNHKFVTPIKRMHMRCNRHMPEAAKDLTEKFNRENIPVSKVRSLLGGSNIGFDERDCYNYLRTGRLQNLEEGDASSVLTYFQRRLRENPQFFYNIQVDIVTGRAVNFFWVDTRSRMAYEHFGDVVTFDTTYKTNAYSMPFAPFTGVNHHFQTIQFGCAILQDETEVSFLWLFTTWLEAVGGRAPKSIITDQGAAMCAAVKKIFPLTRHRLCLWHIKMKFPEKLSHVYHENSKFKTDFEKCLQFTYKVEDFENLWKNIMEEYNLENNVWLQGLYDIRDSWIPVYHRTTFYAGMNTTGRSEDINAFFDEFVKADTNLKDFVEKYEKALEKLVRNEIDEDYLSEHKDRIVHERDLLLKHAGDVYTRNIFKKFSSELFKANNFKASELARDGACDTYLVTNKFCIVEKFIVTWNKETSEGSCECSHFQFTGLLCRHLLKIFDRLDVDQIPQHFILRRWTKGANKFRIIDEQAVQSSDDCSATFRLSHLCRKATQMSCIASEHPNLYKKALEGIDRVIKDVLEERDKIAAISIEASSESPTTQDVVSPVCPVLILDPNVSQTVGRPPKEDDKKKKKESNVRWKRPIEVALKKRKRNCSLCKSPEHDKRSCPKNPNRQPKRQCEPCEPVITELAEL